MSPFCVHHLKSQISTFYFLMLIAFFSLQSCTSSSNSNRKKEESKWKANVETTQGIKNMISISKNFVQTDDISAFKKLEKDLSEEYQLIFKNCTMKGEAHEELHSYLLPINSMLRGLRSDDLNTQKESYIKLSDYLNEYFDQFE